MIRVRTTLLAFLFALIGYYAVGQHGSFQLIKLTLVLLTLAFWYANGTSINDLADEQIDRVNLQKFSAERPLIKGNAGREELRLLAIISGILALVCSFFISPLSTLITAVALLYGYLYSMPPTKLSHHGILAALSLPLWYVLYPVLLGIDASGGSFHRSLVPLLIGMYACFVARILLKDVRDEIGDKKFGKKTVIVQFGLLKTAAASIIFWIIGAFVLSYYWHSLGFTLNILWLSAFVVISLSMLRSEQIFENRLIQVAAMGRFANGVALLLLSYALNAPKQQTLLTATLVTLACTFMGVEALMHLHKIKH